MECESKFGMRCGIEFHAVAMRICTTGSAGYLQLFGSCCTMRWVFSVEKSYEHNLNVPFNVLRPTFLLAELVPQVL